MNSEQQKDDILHHTQLGCRALGIEVDIPTLAAVIATFEMVRDNPDTFGDLRQLSSIAVKYTPEDQGKIPVEAIEVEYEPDAAPVTYKLNIPYEVVHAKKKGVRGTTATVGFYMGTDFVTIDSFSSPDDAKVVVDSLNSEKPEWYVFHGSVVFWHTLGIHETEDAYSVFNMDSSHNAHLKLSELVRTFGVVEEESDYPDMVEDEEEVPVIQKLQEKEVSAVQLNIPYYKKKCYTLASTYWAVGFDDWTGKFVEVMCRPSSASALTLLDSMKENPPHWFIVNDLQLWVAHGNNSRMVQEYPTEFKAKTMLQKMIDKFGVVEDKLPTELAFNIEYVMRGEGPYRIVFDYGDQEYGMEFDNPSKENAKVTETLYKLQLPVWKIEGKTLYVKRPNSSSFEEFIEFPSEEKALKFWKDMADEFGFWNEDKGSSIQEVAFPVHYLAFKKSRNAWDSDVWTVGFWENPDQENKVWHTMYNFGQLGKKRAVQCMHTLNYLKPKWYYDGGAHIVMKNVEFGDATISFFDPNDARAFFEKMKQLATNV